MEDFSIEKATQKRCPACHKVIGQSDKYCPKCGEKLMERTEHKSEQVSKSAIEKMGPPKKRPGAKGGQSSKAKYTGESSAEKRAREEHARMVQADKDFEDRKLHNSFFSDITGDYRHTSERLQDLDDEILRSKLNAQSKMGKSFYETLRGKTDSVYNSKMEKAGGATAELGFGPEAATGAKHRERSHYGTSVGNMGDLSGISDEDFDEVMPRGNRFGEKGQWEDNIENTEYEFDGTKDNVTGYRDEPVGVHVPAGDLWGDGTGKQYGGGFLQYGDGAKSGAIREGTLAGDKINPNGPVVQNTFERKTKPATKSIRDMISRRRGEDIVEGPRKDSEWNPEAYVRAVTPKDTTKTLSEPDNEISNPLLDDGYPLQLNTGDIYRMSLKHSRKEMDEMFRRRGMKPGTKKQY